MLSAQCGFNRVSGCESIGGCVELVTYFPGAALSRSNRNRACASVQHLGPWMQVLSNPVVIRTD